MNRYTIKTLRMNLKFSEAELQEIDAYMHKHHPDSAFCLASRDKARLFTEIALDEKLKAIRG